MARQVRIEFEGAVYHVMCRGDRREAIFEDDEDRRRFLLTLAQAAARTGWRIHAYVLMTNHYHLLLETPEANLVRGMTWFQTTCTVRHNTRHRTSGHLFGGRYKAILVDSEEPEYFTALVDYIHLNPVRAGLMKIAEAKGLLAYAWSSLMGYASPSRRPDWLEVGRGFSVHGWRDVNRDRRAYVERLEKMAREEQAERCGIVDFGNRSLQSTLRRGWYLGSEKFRDWLLEKAGSAIEAKGARSGGQNFHGEEVRDHGEKEARGLIARRLREMALEETALEKLAKSDARKVRIAREVRDRTTVPLRFLAKELKMGTPMNVSRLTNPRVAQEYSPDP